MCSHDVFGRFVNGSGAASEFAKVRIDREVAVLESNIASQRRCIESYADTQATNSCRSPRCQGAGLVMQPAMM